MLKISCASCLGLSPAIATYNSLLKCVAARNREKITKITYFWVQSRLRSLNLIFLKAQH